MRWSCPHCGTNLAVADERLGTGWSFSRCFKCAGFALIRRAEVNVIKVHGAPTGERILSTENHEQTLMSQKSIDALGNLVAAAPAPAQATATAPQGLPSGASAAGAPAWIAQNAPLATPPNTTFGIPNVLPAALPEIPEGSTRFTFTMPSLPKIGFDIKARLLPAAIVIAGVTTVSSGIYFYLQGRELLNRASTPGARPAQSPIQPAAATQPISPAAHAPGANRDQAVEAAASRISDQVRARAMAPIRQMQPEARTPEPRIAPKPEARIEAEPELTGVAPTITNMLVQPAIANAKIRSGPGIDFSLVGIADPETRYVITAWQDRWFRIKPKTAAAAAIPAPQIEGWIRNDLVRTINSE